MYLMYTNEIIDICGRRGGVNVLLEGVMPLRTVYSRDVIYLFYWYHIILILYKWYGPVIFWNRNDIPVTSYSAVISVLFLLTENINEMTSDWYEECLTIRCLIRKNWAFCSIVDMICCSDSSVCSALCPITGGSTYYHSMMEIPIIHCYSFVVMMIRTLEVCHLLFWRPNCGTWCSSFEVWFSYHIVILCLEYDDRSSRLFQAIQWLRVGNVVTSADVGWLFLLLSEIQCVTRRNFFAGILMTCFRHRGWLNDGVADIINSIPIPIL